jgi:short-subunit dehydrogenase
MKILITGGSRGIGKAIATELAKFGHEILIVSQNETKLKEAVSELKSKFDNVKILSLVCDLSKESEIETLKNRCAELGFLPNVLVLNAGVFREGTLINSQSNDFYETINVDLYHIYHCVKNFHSDLKNQENSKIIIIGSTASLEPYPVGALYGVAKWGLRGYAVNLRKELMNDNIGVTLLNPGGTLTDLWEGEDLPPNRLLEPSDLGKLVNTILNLSPQAVVEEITIRPMLGDFHE